MAGISARGSPHQDQQRDQGDKAVEQVDADPPLLQQSDLGRHVFGPLYLMKRHMPGPEDPAPRFSLKIEDRHWYWLYLPVARLTEYVSSKIALLQQGRISIYLLYSFVTLIALLVFVR